MGPRHGLCREPGGVCVGPKTWFVPRARGCVCWAQDTVLVAVPLPPLRYPATCSPLGRPPDAHAPCRACHLPHSWCGAPMLTHHHYSHLSKWAQSAAPLNTALLRSGLLLCTKYNGPGRKRCFEPAGVVETGGVGQCASCVSPADGCGRGRRSPVCSCRPSPPQLKGAFPTLQPTCPSPHSNQPANYPT